MRRTILLIIKLLIPAILALSFTAAKTSASGWKKYAVYFCDANYYYVSSDVTDDLPGVDYLCNSMEGQLCLVNSYLSPDGYGRIPVSAGWPVYTNSIYISLQY